MIPQLADARARVADLEQDHDKVLRRVERLELRDKLNVRQIRIMLAVHVLELAMIFILAAKV